MAVTPDKIYADANVYLDYLLARNDKKTGRSFEDEAAHIFTKVQSAKYLLIISTWVLKEMRGFVEPEETTILLESLKSNSYVVTYSGEEEARARSMSVDSGDALHAIIANREGAKYLVTQNMKHFRQFASLVQPVYPKQI